MSADEGVDIMRRNIAIAMVVAVLGGTTAYADSGCAGPLMREFHESERIVDSLRPDKPGQVRVYASDGSQFTAGQSQWLRGQLNEVGRACVQGDSAAAARLLAEVQQVINAHARP
jgi:hypothetical protein